MVKFKVAFTISAEELFRLAANILPVDDLHVEEVRGAPAPAPAMPKMAQQMLAGRPAPKRGRTYKEVNLGAGINAIIMELLSDGLPHRASEMQPLVAKRGYSRNSVGSRLQQLQQTGLVTQPEYGLWMVTLKSESKTG
jgi:hypothetical protein